MDDCLSNGINTHDDKWTKSVAVGSKGFVNNMKSIMGIRAIGRKSVEGRDSYQLREPATPYGDYFGVEKDDIGPENTYFWDVLL